MNPYHQYPPNGQYQHTQGYNAAIPRVENMYQVPGPEVLGNYATMQPQSQYMTQNKAVHPQSYSIPQNYMPGNVGLYGNYPQGQPISSLPGYPPPQPFSHLQPNVTQIPQHPHVNNFYAPPQASAQPYQPMIPTHNPMINESGRFQLGAHSPGRGQGQNNHRGGHAHNQGRGKAFGSNGRDRRGEQSKPAQQGYLSKYGPATQSTAPQQISNSNPSNSNSSSRPQNFGKTQQKQRQPFNRSQGQRHGMNKSGRGKGASNKGKLDPRLSKYGPSGGPLASMGSESNDNRNQSRKRSAPMSGKTSHGNYFRIQMIEDPWINLAQKLVDNQELPAEELGKVYVPFKEIPDHVRNPIKKADTIDLEATAKEDSTENVTNELENPEESQIITADQDGDSHDDRSEEDGDDNNDDNYHDDVRSDNYDSDPENREEYLPNSDEPSQDVSKETQTREDEA